MVAFGSAALLAIAVGVGLALVRPVELVLCVTIMTIAVTTLVIILRYRPHGDALSLLLFLAVYYLLAYALGPLYIWLSDGADTQTGLGPATMAPALAIAAIGWLSLLAGYFINPLRAIGGVRLSVRTLPSMRSVVVRAVPFYVIGWAARVFTIIQGTYFHSLPAGSEVVSSASNWITVFAASIPTLMVAVLGAYAFSRRSTSSRGGRVIYVVLLIAEIIWFIPTGSRAALLNLLIVAGVIAYYGYQRIPKRFVVVSGLALVFVVFPFYIAYRGNGDVYQSDPTGSLNRAIADTFSRDPVDFIGAGVGYTLARFNDIESASRILEGGRDQLLPAVHGESLSWIVFAVLPRAVAPDKPDPGLFGNQVGRVSGMIRPTDFVTSINFGQPYEFFFSADWIGVMLGMAAVGAIYRCVSDLTRSRRTNPLVLAVYATSALSLTTSLGVIVSHGLAGEIRAMALDGVILALLSGGFVRVAATERRAAVGSPVVEGT